MSTAPEIQKLAHQLGTDPSELAFLDGVPREAVRTLRSQIGDYLFDADKHHFTKVAAVSRTVPVAIAVKVTEFALPPLIAARTAELMEPSRAVDMVNRLSDAFLADVSAAMDPARAAEVIAQIPAAKVAKVGTELARRGEWVVMGGFVSLVSPDALRAAVGDLDGEQLLRVGYVLDDLSRMDAIAAMLTDTQLDGMLRAAVSLELWPELDGVLANLRGDQSARIAARFACAPQHVRTTIDAAPLGPAAREALA